VKHYPAERIRNVGLFGHGGSGKTSLAEALLFDTKVISRLGTIQDGNTVLDFDPDEIKRHHSVSLAVAPVEWRDTKINVIDTPGYADFRGDVLSTLRVIDGAIIVIDAASGVQVGTEQAWRLCGEHGLPRMIFVNNLDRENADFPGVLEQLKQFFGKIIAPVQFPIGHDKGFKGIVDLLTEESYLYHDNHDGGFETGPIPADLDEQVHFYRQQLVDSIAEHDEALMVRYLDGEAIGTDELVAGLEHAVEAGLVVPVLCGAAIGNRGVQRLMDGVIDYFPPASHKTFTPASGDVVGTDEHGPFAAFVFKTLADPHVGRVSYFRVLRGVARSNSTVVNATQGKPERLGQLFYMRGKEHLNTDAVDAGDIGAVNKLTATTTGDTIADEKAPVAMPKIVFPTPAYAAAVKPKTKADLDKLGQALQRMLEEDPSLTLGRDPVTADAVLSGLGEPHVIIAIERMSRRSGVNVEVALPHVPYRETIGAKTVAEYKHKKQTGGAGQYGHVILELEPLAEGEFEFTERVVGGSVPRNFYPAVEKGVREALESGPIAGFPVVDVRVTLTDGSSHDVDSNEMSFKIAAKEAFKKGVLAAKPVLLEPVMALEITVPEQYTGDVMSDLNGKRAQVGGMTQGAAGFTTIEATAPAGEIQRYATDLRSITQGRGAYTATFSHYQPAPTTVAEAVKAAVAREQAGTAH
jgi:elongation factor G